MQRVHVGLVGDRHADLADLAAGELVVGVVAGLRRQVERHREAGLALGEVAPVERVGGLRGRMARVGAHHPGAVSLRKSVLAHRCTDCMVRRPCADPSSTVPGSPRGFARSTCATPCRGAATASRRRGGWTSSGTATSPRPATSSWRTSSSSAAFSPPSACSTSAAASAAWRGRWPATCRPTGPTTASTSTATASRGAGGATGASPTSISRSPTCFNAALQPARRPARATSTASRTTTRASTSSSPRRVFTAPARGRRPTHYARRVARACWRPAGACFATFFLLDDDCARGDRRRAAPRSRSSTPTSASRSLDEALPEEAVAYDEEWVLEALRTRADVRCRAPGAVVAAAPEPRLLPGHRGRRMREIDVLHLRARRGPMCCFAIDDVIVDPGPESSHRTLLDGARRLRPARRSC